MLYTAATGEFVACRAILRERKNRSGLGAMGSLRAVLVNSVAFVNFLDIKQERIHDPNPAKPELEI
jgi:hypothetical protein